MTTTLEKIAQWATELKLEQIPQRVIDKAKLQLMSMMAAVYSGFPTRAARAIREVALLSRANGRATVFPVGDKTSVTMAVMANAAASMALDFDDYLFMGHTGHSSVLASMALAEELGLGGKDFLLAQIAANEAEGRLGASVVLGHQNGQLWTHIHALGSSLAGSLLMGLDAHACANAMAISLYQPPMAMWPGFMGPDSKLLSAAWPTRDGLYAARLASWGLTGPLGILDDKRGFGSRFAHQFLSQMLTGWGEAWVTDTLSYKIYPGCAYLDAAMDALFEAMSSFKKDTDRKMEPADVVKIEVSTTLLGSQMQKLVDSQAPIDLSAVRANFSIPLSFAIAINAGRLTPSELDDKALEEAAPQILDLAEKIKVRHDWSMTIQMIETMTEHMPLGNLLSELDIRNLLSGSRDISSGSGLLSDLKPQDILRIAAFLWERTPGLVRRAGQVAAEGISRMVGSQSANDHLHVFDLGQVEMDKLGMPFAAKVDLTVHGHRQYSYKVKVPRAAAGSDPAKTSGLVRKKFRDAAATLIGEEKLEKALALMENLEDIDEISELTKNLSLD